MLKIFLAKLLMLTALMSFLGTDCMARVCFLANGDDCDDNATTNPSNLPSCEGDNCPASCDLITKFPVKGSLSTTGYTSTTIREYANTHGFDSNNITRDGDCYVLHCKYSSLSNCEHLSHKHCCRSLENSICYEPCSICSSNRIGRSYYPYADKTMENCPFVGENSMKEYKITGDTNLIMGYRINAFNNILFSYSPLFDDSVVWSDDRVWKCDNDCKDDAIDTCKNLSAQSAHEGSTVKGLYCYQGTAYDFEQPSNSSTSSSLLNNLYCTKSCMVCNELRGYYGNENKCIALNDGRNCEHTETHDDFATDNEVCYYMNGTCSKFTNDYYTFGDEDLSCDSGAQTALDPKNRHVYSGGHSQECHYCRCTFSNVNVNTCNWLSCNADVFNRVGDNLETCINMGYTVEKVNLTTATYSIDEYMCIACPFDANWWKCLPRTR